MPVILYSKPPKRWPKNASRYCVAASSITLNINIPKVENLSLRLEKCFEKIRNIWWKIGTKLAQLPSGKLAHMPSCSTYASDFGQMLAWVTLAKELSQDPETTIIICPDPWLFRAIADLNNVTADKVPRLLITSIQYWIRGFASRLKLVVRLMSATLRCRSTIKNHDMAQRVLLVYPHPESRHDGYDSYFGNRMHFDQNLYRLLHTNGNLQQTLYLTKHSRTASLHAWGNFLWLPNLLFTRWKLPFGHLNLPHPWLIKRAVHIEASGASAAANLWQIKCQNAWINARERTVIVWPWENHPWERELTQKALKKGIKTVGYQHTVVGPHMYNQSPNANHNGIASLPDTIISNGPSYTADLVHFGVPMKRLKIGGSYRQKFSGEIAFDPNGPIFVGLSNNPKFSEEMLRAIRQYSRSSNKLFLIKSHPMYPYHIDPSPSMRSTENPIGSDGGISALIFCTGTIGLEGLLNGIPTIRFQPEGFVAMNILPTGIEVVSVDAKQLSSALNSLSKKQQYINKKVFSKIKESVWCEALEFEST